MDTPTPAFYSPHEVSVRLGVPVPTLTRWRHKGTGPKGLEPVKVHHRWKYPVQAVEGYINNLTKKDQRE
jgi:predicted site-specific integrase-resolvase